MATVRCVLSAGGSNVGGIVAIAAIVVIVLGLAAWLIVMRARKKSQTHSQTVPAVFIAHRGSTVNPSATDRGRMAKENTNIGLENHVLVFQNEQTGEELRFSFSGEFRCPWEENRRGTLVYSGRRFIDFKQG